VSGMDETRLVRRAPARPLVWLGEREPASHVAPALGARFPASDVKARDFVFEIERA
jgi:hypothetical protein